MGSGWNGVTPARFVRERPGTNSGVRYQALYDDVKGHRRSAGTFVTDAEALRAPHHRLRTDEDEMLPSRRPL